MADILIASVPIHGHVAPMLAAAASMVQRGHRIRFLTGARFAADVEASGSVFVPLPAEADFDDRIVAAGLADAQRPDGIRGLRYDVTRTFLAPARAQYDALVEALTERTDAVMVDPTFIGAGLLAAGPRAQRPPVIIGGVLPLTLASNWAPPFGPGIQPRPGPIRRLDRARFRLLRLMVERVVFAQAQRDFDALSRTVIGRGADAFVLDWVSITDGIVQFSAPSFEYPRPDATVPIRFAGPIIGPSSGELPDWWGDLDSGRPVVLVTQGTIANNDLGMLVRPAIEGLAGADLLVVVTTGGPAVADLGPLPANVRAAEFLPYADLFPKVDVFVTNGGYGGVQFALSHGIPLVAGGAGEDKPEVAARVGWSGVGVNLRTGRPSARAVADAVATVLRDSRYRAAAQLAAREIAAARGVVEIEELIAGRAVSPG